ncbi:hypothetical protein Q5752_002287 [Cryptotrichosporon argae]
MPKTLLDLPPEVPALIASYVTRQSPCPACPAFTLPHLDYLDDRHAGDTLDDVHDWDETTQDVKDAIDRPDVYLQIGTEAEFERAMTHEDKLKQVNPPEYIDVLRGLKTLVLNQNHFSNDLNALAAHCPNPRHLLVADELCIDAFCVSGVWEPYKTEHDYVYFQPSNAAATPSDLMKTVIDNLWRALVQRFAARFPNLTRLYFHPGMTPWTTDGLPQFPLIGWQTVIADINPVSREVARFSVYDRVTHSY